MDAATIWLCSSIKANELANSVTRSSVSCVAAEISLFVLSCSVSDHAEAAALNMPPMYGVEERRLRTNRRALFVRPFERACLSGSAGSAGISSSLTTAFSGRALMAQRADCVKISGAQDARPLWTMDGPLERVVRRSSISYVHLLLTPWFRLVHHGTCGDP